MGSKPCKPVVSYDKAIEAICRSGEIKVSDLKKLYIAAAGGNEGNNLKIGQENSLKLSRIAFKEKFAFVAPFFDLGEKAVERLFNVLGAEDSWIDYESFVCAIYMFTRSTKVEKQRLLFNMFDFNGSGSIKKKEFRDMTMAIIKGDSTYAPADFETDFKALSKLMTDSAMAMYDTNRDGKLSFQEWLRYSETDKNVQSCFKALSKGCDLNQLISNYKVNK
mmetsp:Transcript_1405/g.1697  ORF Transcript_1405/g.1697 Transcript_1405/m.1697 type:complete len:220 (+) Transcript_1405:159-818(+)|eukprot:CAMPEP_0184013572 /NCGR_PEP_ID=MMETSP0954-20121128/5097_1 /TAXON_ID=627963 /ORGANISM="Aplanochytrium sp, Strain PBS07" /LENGTH=219 /DNA_ID=CAMNT_0026293795 /DNA_START=165 /DNA_END=824 /DNA_ORIENTATION=+